MATKKKVSTKKATQKVNDVPDKQKAHVMSIGNKRDMAVYDAATSDESMYRLQYQDGVNMYALVSPAFAGIQEHWIRVGSDFHRLVCPVHLTNDEDKIFSRWGFDEGCPFCATKKKLYEESPKDSKDVVDKRKREIARDISSRPNYYFFAIRGEGDTTRVRGKKIVKPYFDSYVARKLVLSKDAFEKLKKAIEEADLPEEKLYGLPVNFAGGKNEGGFASIQQIDLYPDFQIKDLPETNIIFDGLDKVDQDRVQQIHEEWSKNELPLLLAGTKGRDKSATKKSSTKKSTGKKK